jgi:hypothetical protein
MQAYVLHARLPLILPASMNQQSSLFAVVSDSKSSSPSQSSAGGREETTPAGPTVSGAARTLIGLVRKTWLFLLRHGLWFIALGLAALQAAGGVILLWDFRGVEPLEITPWGLLRKRPMPFLCFIVLNIALAMLAGLGGAEFSPGSIAWAIPASIAAALALVLPWLATYMLHYLLQSASECLGPVTAIVFSIGGVVLSAVVQAVSTLFLVLVATLLAATFVCSCCAGRRPLGPAGNERVVRRCHAPALCKDLS